MKYISVSALILILFVFGIGSVSAACLDGDTGNNTLDCDSNPADNVFEGDFGDDTMTVSGNIPGDVTGDSSGSVVGLGDGGNDTITINAGVTVNGIVLGDYVTGNGGDDIIIINGTVNGVVLGDNAAGIGGNDTIIISGSAKSFVLGNDGNDTVTIHFGATVAGSIEGNNGTDTLQFQGAGASDTELATAQTFAATCNVAQNCAGSLTFAGKNYSFSTFERLIILLQQIEQGIIPDGGTTSAPIAPGEICAGAVKIFRLSNGDLEVYSGFDVLAPNGFLVGVIPAGTVPSGQSFSNPNAPIAGWSAVFNADSTITVTTSDGGVVSSNCRV